MPGFADPVCGCRPHPHPRARGFTLTELMIALTLGLMVTGGAVQLFLTGRSAHADMERIAALNDNLGFVTAFIARDVRSAGLRSDGSIDLGWALEGTDFPFELRRTGARACDGGLPDADGHVVNRYTLGADSIRCSSPGASPQAMIAGVRAATMCVIHAGDADCGGSGVPIALRITLVLTSHSRGLTYDHEVAFTVAMRNAVLARYNALR